MTVFKKQRKWIYITFIIITIVIIAIIIIPKLTGNFLKGSWETSDGLRKYTFDDNTLTISSIRILNFTDIHIKIIYLHCNQIMKQNIIMLV